MNAPGIMWLAGLWLGVLSFVACAPPTSGTRQIELPQSNTGAAAPTNTVPPREAPVETAKRPVPKPASALPKVVITPLWATMAHDHLMRDVITYLYASHKDSRPLIDAAARREVDLHWYQLPDELFGGYDKVSNTIVVSSDLRDASIAVLGAVISHELVHAVRPETTGAFAGDCVQEEVIAFSFAAGAYASFGKEYHKEGPEEEFMEEVVKAWREKLLRPFVLANPDYQVHCLGRKLYG